MLDELAERYGPIVGFGSGPVSMALVGEPTALREMFSLPIDSFRWGHKFNALGFVVGPGSMIVADGADHARIRASVRAAFSRRRLNRWIPMIVERTDAAVDALVLEIVVRSLFGPGLAERSAEIGELFRAPQDYLEAPAIRQLPHPFPFTARSRVRADRRALDAIIDGEIETRRRSPSQDPFDVLETLVVDGTLTDGEIRDQVVTLLGAGYDTTSASLAWMLWCCALAPPLWDQLRAEADDVLAPSSTTVDHLTLGRLDLANRVMRETTRLHPAGVISPREAAVDIELGGYTIPAGTLIPWSAHLAGRDPTAWTDPLRFDPDRFLDPSPDQQAMADLAWVPFGRGARNCIGFALAQMELTLIIARLAQRLDLTTDRVGKPKPVGMVVNRPEGGAPMTVRAR